MHVMIPGHVTVVALTKGVVDLTIPYIYVGFWALKVRCTQYGFCGEDGFQEVFGHATSFW